MRILIASPSLPWPLDCGGRVAQYRTFEALRGACAFSLVVPVCSLAEEADARNFAEQFPDIAVEPVRCSHFPPPPSVRAFLRRKGGRLLRTMFPSHQAQTPGDATPCYPFNCLNPEFVRAIEGQFSKGCDIFQAEFADMLTLGPLMAGRVPSLFVHHQLHYVYARRFLEAHRASSANARYLTERMIREESTYLNTFNSIIVFSEVDCQALNTFCPHLEVHVSPFPSPEDPISDVLPFNSAVVHFVFVACEGHGPNRDGLRWFMKDVWPAIKNRLPDASMEVIGKWSPAGQAGIPNYEDIRFVGFVPELGKALQNKIMIVPVWIGSGIRTKILAAWSASCPVVTTTIGAEGLPGQPGEHFIIADNAPAFASACIELSQNTDRLNRMAASGLDLVQKHYSLDAVRKTRLEIYEKLLATHRLDVTSLFRAEGGVRLDQEKPRRNGQAIHYVP